MNSGQQQISLAGDPVNQGYSSQFVLFGLLWLTCLSTWADVDRPAMPENGVCQFLLHHYALSAKDQTTINLIIADLVKQHEQAFDFTHHGDLRIQIRIFGREADYRQFALTNNARLEEWLFYITNVAGYYSVRDREVVTWR